MDQHPLNMKDLVPVVWSKCPKCVPLQKEGDRLVRSRICGACEKVYAALAVGFKPIFQPTNWCKCRFCSQLHEHLVVPEDPIQCEGCRSLYSPSLNTIEHTEWTKCLECGTALQFQKVPSIVHCPVRGTNYNGHNNILSVPYTFWSECPRCLSLRFHQSEADRYFKCWMCRDEYHASPGQAFVVPLY